MAPTTYQRKPGAIPRRHCSPSDLKAALEEVVKGNSIRCAADRYKINRLTLNRYFHRLKEQEPRLTLKKVHNTSLDFFIPNYKKRQIFSDELERLLEESLAETAKVVPIITTVQIRTIAYEFSCRHEVPVPDIWHRNHMAGFEWYRAFIDRHPHLLKVLPLRSGQGLPLPQKEFQKKVSSSHTRSIRQYITYNTEDDYIGANIKLEPEDEFDEFDDDEYEEDDPVVFSIGIKEEDEDNNEDDGTWIIVVD